MRFDLLREDVLAGAQYDDLLLPPGDAQEAPVVEIAQVAGQKPALLEYAGVRVWPAEITGAKREDLKRSENMVSQNQL